MTEQATPLRPALSQCDLPVGASVLVGVWCLTGAAACLGVGALLSFLRLFGLSFVHEGSFPHTALGLAVFGVWWVSRWNQVLPAEDDTRTLGNWMCGLTLVALAARLPMENYPREVAFVFDPRTGLPFPDVLWVSFLLALPAVTNYLSRLAEAMQRNDLVRLARRLQWVMPAAVVLGAAVSHFVNSKWLGSSRFDRGLPLASAFSQALLAALALSLLWRLAPAVTAAVAMAAAHSGEPLPAIESGLTYESPRAALRRRPLAMRMAWHGAWGLFVTVAARTAMESVSIIQYLSASPAERMYGGRSPGLLATATYLLSYIMSCGTLALSLLLVAWRSAEGRPVWRSPLAVSLAVVVVARLLLASTVPGALGTIVGGSVAPWLVERWGFVLRGALDLWLLLLCIQAMRIGRALGREAIVILAAVLLGCEILFVAVTCFPSWFQGLPRSIGMNWLTTVVNWIALLLQCVLWGLVAQALNSLVAEPEAIGRAEQSVSGYNAS